MKINLTKNTNISELKSENVLISAELREEWNILRKKISNNADILAIEKQITDLETKKTKLVDKLKLTSKVQELSKKLYDNTIKITRYYNDIEDGVPEDIAKHFKSSYSGTTSQGDGSLSVVWWGFEESKDFYIVKEKGKSYWSGLGSPRGYSPTAYKLFCTKIHSGYHGITEFEGKISKAKVKILEDKMIEIINEKKTKKRK